MLQSFAAANGDTLIFDMSAPGGYTFQQHTTNATTIAKIFSQQWDIVVLQEQSQMPAFPPAQVATDVYPYARKLDSLVHANDTCTQTMFLMTWGRRNGDVANCAGYPAICTYAGMQGRLRESYMQMATDNDAIIAPAGPAWKVVIDSFPAIDLYQSDSSHPSMSGSYLEMCILYNSIFHKKARGSSYTAGLTGTVTQTLQRIADKVTLDSIDTWQHYGHYPYANFGYVTISNTLALANQSMHADKYYWSLGNGYTDSAINISYTYSAGGTYVVSLTAKNGCFSETRRDTIHVGTTGINPAPGSTLPVYVQYEGYGNVTFMPPERTYDMLDIYDSKGSRIARHQLMGNTLKEQLTPGFYFFKAYSSDGSAAYYGKLTP